MEKETAEPKKGRVTYVKTSRGLFPSSILAAFDITKANNAAAERKKSNQLRELTEFVTDKNLIPHPFDVDAFITLQEDRKSVV